MMPAGQRPPEPDPTPSAGDARRTRRADARLSAEEVLHRWGAAYQTPRRPEVVPADPEVPGTCLCGEPAELVVETNWFSGRRSRDPVCRRHVDEVVRAIKKQQARRNGA